MPPHTLRPRVLPGTRSPESSVIAKGYDAEAAGEVASTPNPASLRPVLLAVIVASFGAFAFGYHLGVINGPLEAIAADLGFAGDVAKQGLVVSSVLAGATVGSLSGSGLADGLGRRGSLLLTALPLLTGALLSATATQLQTMLAGRLAAGVGIGLASALVPLYISEIAPTSVRGSLGSVNQLAICLGILAALVANVYIPATAWRTMFALAALPPVLMAAGMFFSPDSPRHLAAKGKLKAAEEAAVRLWGAQGVAQLAGEGGSGKETAAPGLLEVLTCRPVLLGCALFVFQQFTGINAIIYFSSTVFKQAGIASSALASAAVGAINVVGTLLAAGSVESAGRKQLLTVSYTGMGVAMVAMAAAMSIPALASYSGPLALTGTLAYVLAFAFGSGPVSGLLVPEMTPAKYRGRAVSLAMVTHWACNFAVGQLFLGLVAAHGLAAVYGGFAAMCLAAVLFINALLPETKGRSLEEIERSWAAA